MASVIYLDIRCRSNETTVSRQPVADFFRNNNPSRDMQFFLFSNFTAFKPIFLVKNITKFRFCPIFGFHAVQFTLNWLIELQRFEITMVTPKHLLVDYFVSWWEVNVISLSTRLRQTKEVSWTITGKVVFLHFIWLTISACFLAHS